MRPASTKRHELSRLVGPMPDAHHGLLRHLGQPGSIGKFLAPTAANARETFRSQTGKSIAEPSVAFDSIVPPTASMSDLYVPAACKACARIALIQAASGVAACPCCSSSVAVVPGE